MSAPVEIYALKCPDTDEVRYIGKANDSKKRLKSHIRDSRRRNTPVYCWIRKLMNHGKMPTMVILVSVGHGTPWQDVEKAEIAKYKAMGARLLNLAEGGDEPLCSPEQRAANGSKVLSQIRNDPQRAKIFEVRRRYSCMMRDYLKRKNYTAYNRRVAKIRALALRNHAAFAAFTKYRMVNFYGEEID